MVFLINESERRFKNAYELANLGALKYSILNKLYVFQCMGKIVCVEFQRALLKFHKNILPIRWKTRFLYITPDMFSIHLLFCMTVGQHNGAYKNGVTLK